MSEVKPRHAIGYHFWTWHDIYDEILETVRQTYDGPLTLADDMTVWNVTDNRLWFEKQSQLRMWHPQVQPRHTESQNVNRPKWQKKIGYRLI